MRFFEGLPPFDLQENREGCHATPDLPWFGVVEYLAQQKSQDNLRQQNESHPGRKGK